MSDCCSNGQSSELLNCHLCQQKGKPIQISTLKSQLKPQAMRQTTDGQYFFCKTQECKIVYFDAHSQFKTEDIREKVFQKDPSPDCYVCYCFGFSRGEIFKDAQTDKPGIAQQITAWTAAKKCACELRNPQGSCCLGNVKQVEKEGLSISKSRPFNV